jgi:hypothetical protein
MKRRLTLVEFVVPNAQIRVGVDCLVQVLDHVAGWPVICESGPVVHTVKIMNRKDSEHFGCNGGERVDAAQEVDRCCCGRRLPLVAG